MIAMQYRIGLPADYDMGIIERRIAERGHLTDALSGLAFKTYLHARHEPTHAGSQNLYAPFYLWLQPKGMSDFLSGPGFAAVAASFGRPHVKTWAIWHADYAVDLSAVTHATQQLAPLSTERPLEVVREAEKAHMQAMLDDGAQAVVCGFDPASWQLLRFALWREAPTRSQVVNADTYAVGHVSQPFPS